MKSFVEKVIEFNTIAGTTGEQFDARKTSLYMGLVLEEVAEMVAAIKPTDNQTVMVLAALGNTLDGFADAFKQGRFDSAIGSMSLEDRTEALDAFVDVAVVAVGGGIAVGSDVLGACHAVADNNLSKYPLVDGVRVVLKDENGKVKKPEGYKSVELTEFIR
jgi:predicted HAD superfamily Cof-like phosphohydrolase